MAAHAELEATGAAKVILIHAKSTGAMQTPMQSDCITWECRRLNRELELSNIRRDAANSRWCKSDANWNAKGHARSASASAYTTSGVLPDGQPEGGVGGGRRPKSPWTKEQFAAAAKSFGKDDNGRANCSARDANECWAHYDSQGWVKGNGFPIAGDPRSLLTTWLSRKKPEAEKPGGRKLDQRWKEQLKAKEPAGPVPAAKKV